GASPVLPALPTRRSSDLPAAAGAVSGAVHTRSGAGCQLHRRRSAKRPESEREEKDSDEEVAAMAERVLEVSKLTAGFPTDHGFLDRKSTRLNSSHVKISY